MDSPYSVQDGETRDCLNVVSTLRGAIRKRTGSTTFAGGPVAASFPTLVVTDSFVRANENPLSNAAKWSQFGELTNGRGEVLSNHWVPSAAGGTIWGGYWNAAEQNNPAVAVKVTKPDVNAAIALWIVTAAPAHTGYQLEVEGGQWVLARYSNDSQEKAVVTTRTALSAGDRIGLSLRAGVVVAWVEHGGAWTKVLEFKDSTYTKGYGGFEVATGPTTGVQLNEFAVGEATAPLELEFTGVAPVTVSSGTYLIASAGTSLYSINSGGEISSIGTGFTSGARWSVVQAPEGTKKTGGPVYLCNGIDKPQYWSGAAKNTAVAAWAGESGETFYEDATSKEHVPNGKYAIFAGNRVWMAGMSDDTSAVRFSAPSPIGEGGEQGDPTNWPKNNVVRFDSSDKRPITGLGTVGPYVLVFKAHKVWAIHNLDTGENRQVSSSVGCVSHRSIVETGAGTFFLTPDQGVYLTNGSKVQEVSYNVRPTILAATPAQIGNAAGTYLNNHYYLSFASGTSNVANLTLDYDIILKSWWLHDLAGNQWAVWEPTSGEPALFTCPPKAAAGVVKCFVPEVYTDSGAVYAGNGALAAWWISPWEPFAYYIFRHRIRAPFIKKRVRQVFFDGSGEIIPLIYKDFTEGGTQLPGTVGNSDSRSFPINFTTGKQTFGNEDEAQKFGGEVYAGVQMIFGNPVRTAAARLYSLGTAFVWGVGFGNNSAEGFEVDSYMYAVAFRKS